jgi:hypothetical protein
MLTLIVEGSKCGSEFTSFENSSEVKFCHLCDKVKTSEAMVRTGRV